MEENNEYIKPSREIGIVCEVSERSCKGLKFTSRRYHPARERIVVVANQEACYHLFPQWEVVDARQLEEVGDLVHVAAEEAAVPIHHSYWDLEAEVHVDGAAEDLEDHPSVEVPGGQEEERLRTQTCRPFALLQVAVVLQDLDLGPSAGHLAYPSTEAILTDQVPQQQRTVSLESSLTIPTIAREERTPVEAWHQVEAKEQTENSSFEAQAVGDIDGSAEDNVAEGTEAGQGTLVVAEDEDVAEDVAEGDAEEDMVPVEAVLDGLEEVHRKGFQAADKPLQLVLWPNEP